MVLGLPGQIDFDLIHVGIIHGEGAISRLPCETAPRASVSWIHFDDGANKRTIGAWPRWKPWSIAPCSARILAGGSRPLAMNLGPSGANGAGVLLHDLTRGWRPLAMNRGPSGAGCPRALW